MTDSGSSDVTNLSAGVQAFTSNAFLVTGDRTVLVDAGTNYDIVSKLREALDGDAGDLDALVLTHTHPDHVGNTAAVREGFDVETWGFDAASEHVDHAIADGETIRIGDDDYTALHTPGHKDDHLFFHAPDGGIAFAGDLVFQGGSFGRTDLDEGNRRLLVESIEAVLDAVDDSLDTVYCGHGAPITGDAVASIEQSLRAAKTY